MKIFLVKFIEDGTIECAFTSLDRLMSAYGMQGYIMVDWKLYKREDSDNDKPIYRVTTTELKGKIRYEGKMEV